MIEAPEHNKEKLAALWKQKTVPVLFRQGKGMRLLVSLPHSDDNYRWLKKDHRSHPDWNAKFKCWEVPKAWFNDIVKLTLGRYDELYIIQPYREQEKCAPACWIAEGHECECSCMGANHGSHSSSRGWLVVSDSFATRWRERELACRHLSRPKDTP